MHRDPWPVSSPLACPSFSFNFLLQAGLVCRCIVLVGLAGWKVEDNQWYLSDLEAYLAKKNHHWVPAGIWQNNGNSQIHALTIACRNRQTLPSVLFIQWQLHFCRMRAAPAWYDYQRNSRFDHGPIWAVPTKSARMYSSMQLLEKWLVWDSWYIVAQVQTYPWHRLPCRPWFFRLWE